MTTKLVDSWPDLLPRSHEMSIGQRPVVVRPPTFHFHVTTPDEFAFLSPSPLAVADPDAYSTLIEQRAPFAVLIDTDAVAFGRTETVRFVTLTESGFGAAVGFAVGSADIVGEAGSVSGKGRAVGKSAARSEHPAAATAIPNSIAGMVQPSR